MAILCLSLLLPGPAIAQDMPYAREVVQTLASESFQGRGYVGYGNKRAAEYMCSQFEQIGLKPLKKSYIQPFTTPVNTFPGKMELTLDGSEKTPGIDFLIDAGSPGIQGTYHTVTLTIEQMLDLNRLTAQLKTASGKFLVIPAYNKDDYSKEQQSQIADVINFVKYGKDCPAAGSIVCTNDKLTWDASTTRSLKPSFTIVNDSTHLNIQEVKVDVENTFIPKFESQNIIGYTEGENPDSLIVFVAHYDHIGMMGESTIFPGANDNASGVAMLLNMAKYYQTKKPKYNMVFIAFGGEELGLVGSKYFVEHPLFKLSKIKFLINFDLAGTGEEGIQVVNGKQYKDRFDRLVEINKDHNLLAQVKIRGEACNSDHCLFYMKKVPCFFIYTLGGIKAYHDVFDKSETLPLTEFEDYFKLVTLFVNGL